MEADVCAEYWLQTLEVSESWLNFLQIIFKSFANILLVEIIWFPTNGDNIKIVFKSDHVNNRKGFMAKIRQLRNSCPPYVINRIPNIMQSSEPKPEVFHRQPVYLGSYCDIYIGEVIGDLRSPGYPYGYHNNQSCHYSIRRYWLKLGWLGWN